MSWSPDLYIGEMRPWPESVTVRRGNESKAYVPLGETLATYDGERDILFVVSEYMPHEVRVTKPDARGRDVYTARVHTYVPDKVAHKVTYTEDGIVGRCTCDSCDRSVSMSFAVCPWCGARFEEDE